MMVKVMGSNHYHFHKRIEAFTNSIISNRQFSNSQSNTVNPTYPVLGSCDSHKSNISASTVKKIKNTIYTASLNSLLPHD